MRDIALPSDPILNPHHTRHGQFWKLTSLPTISETLSRALAVVGHLASPVETKLLGRATKEDTELYEHRRRLYLALENAEALDDWEAAAQELDHVEGNDLWKLEPGWVGYNDRLIESRLNDLEHARGNGDIRAMMYQIRTALSRDLGGMGNADLYRHSHTGTKRLIERYVDSTIQTIDAIVEQSAVSLAHDFGDRDLLESMLYARQSFGRSALMLSGGATFGMLHIGVLKCLFEAKLLPRIISGSSAGSILSALICTRTDEEIPGMIDEFPYGDLGVFEGRGGEDFVGHLRSLFTNGTWSDITNLTRVMRGMMGDITFQEAYNRTRRILNICVSTESMYELPRLLNYITAPNVMIWSAVATSCALPLVFSSSELLVRDPLTGEHSPWNPTPQRWIDGSVDNDLPMTKLAELFNVNHFIVSQVNPHIVPFLTRDRLQAAHRKAMPPKHLSPSKGDSEWLCTLTTLARDEAMHRLQFMAELGLFPNLMTKLRSILSQKYSGDIDILPEISIQDLPKIITNPTPEFMLRSCLLGERATWPKLSRIKDQCAIELALDRAVHCLRARVVFSNSQVDLRRLATAIVPTQRQKVAISDSTSRENLPAANAPRIPKTLRRRGSGGSVHIISHGRSQISGSVLADGSIDDEDRLEMSSRNDLNTPILARKPCLKRATRSHFDIHEVHPGVQPECGSLRGSLAIPTDAKVQPLEGEEQPD